MDAALRRLVRERAGEDGWREHFEWRDALLTGRTPVGRATVNLLAVNHPDYVLLREALIDEGTFPPA